MPDTCSPDTCWDYKERIHQYREDTYEKWGSTPREQIDTDLVDATIVPGSGQKSLIPTSYTTVSNGTGSVNFLFGINNGKNNSGLHSGEAVGAFYDTADWQGFAYFGGNTTKTRGANTVLEGINNRKQIVGDNGTDGLYAASISAPLQTLDYPGAQSTELIGINDAGWIIGNYSNDGVADHCILFKPDAKGGYTNSTPVPVNPPSETSTYCSGLNGLGQILVYGANTGPFLDDAEGGDPNAPANFSPFPFYALTGVAPYGINNNGVMIVSV